MANKHSSGRSGNTQEKRNNGQNEQQRSTSGKGHAGLTRLFQHQLADLYYVEKQLVQHLPKMAEAAQNEELVQAFKDHLSETEGHIKHLEAIFKEVGTEAKAQKCEAIDGILKEGQQLMQDFKGDAALDAALVCAAQKVEHYEITSYGSLCAFAEQLGMDSVCDRLEEILDQEKSADERMSRLAEDTLNIEADTEEAEDEEGQEEAGSGKNTTKQKAQATA
ncbi:MAG: ferritin-like domain-containing protein [Flavobacteriales bacterium]